MKWKGKAWIAKRMTCKGSHKTASFGLLFIFSRQCKNSWNEQSCALEVYRRLNIRIV